MLLDELHEALERALPYKITDNTDEEFYALFKANDRQIRVIIDKQDIGWYVEFAELSKHETGGDRHQYTATGKGAEFQVFATVKAVLNDFIKQRKPSLVYFTSDKEDKSRSKLYASLSKKFKPAGYKLIVNPPEIMDDMSSGVEVFAFVKE